MVTTPCARLTEGDVWTPAVVLTTTSLKIYVPDSRKSSAVCTGPTAIGRIKWQVGEIQFWYVRLCLCDCGIKSLGMSGSVCDIKSLGMSGSVCDIKSLGMSGSVCDWVIKGFGYSLISDKAYIVYREWLIRKAVQNTHRSKETRGGCRRGSCAPLDL